MFKRTAAYFFSWMLLAVFLLATSGMKIYSHACNSSGKTEYSILTQPESCCPAEKVKTTCCATKKIVQPVKKDCCSDSEFSSRLDTDHFLPNEELHLNQEMAALQSFIVALLLPEKISGENVSYNEPPPIPGRDILLNKRVLII